MSNKYKRPAVVLTEEMKRAARNAPLPMLLLDSISARQDLEFESKFYAAIAAAPQPPAEPVVWGAPKTVGQLIRQLQTLDPALETVALYRLPDDIPGVGGKVKQGHISTSYERMEGIWLGPYKGDGRKVLAFWTKLDPRPVPDGEFLTQTPPLGDIYESHAIVAAAYKQLLSALGNEEMSHSDALAAISAKPATAKVDVQAEFEAWFLANVESDEGLTLERSAARPEDYELDETAQLYRGWLGRAKLDRGQA